jgi:hypothetical protein
VLVLVLPVLARTAMVPTLADIADVGICLP